MKNNSHTDLAKECETIIKNNNPEKSMQMISNIILPSNKKVGKKLALEIFMVYADKSVKYDAKIYQNNINSFKNKVKKNIKIASNY